EVREVDGSAEQLLRTGQVDLMLSSGETAANGEQPMSYRLQRLAIDLGINAISEDTLARSVVRSLIAAPTQTLAIKPWRQYLSGRTPSSFRQIETYPRVVETVSEGQRLKIFIRQPFTETGDRESSIIQG